MGIWQHLLQGGNLAIRSPGRRAPQQLDGAIGKLLFQFAHCCRRGVVEICHSEDEFVLRIILEAMAPKSLVNLRICALERFENTDRRCKVRLRNLFSLTQKACCTP